MVRQLAFDLERAERAVSSFTLATDLADHLVRQGVPFREAHAVVGGLVADALERDIDLTQLTEGDLAVASPSFGRPPELSAEASVRAKRTQGGTGPHDVAGQLDAARDRIEERGRRLEAQG